MADNLQKLENIVNLLDGDYVLVEEIVPLLSELIEEIKTLRSDVTKQTSTQIKNTEEKLERKVVNTNVELARQLTSLINDISTKVKKLKLRHGQDGHTPTKRELTDLISPLIPDPIPGENGDDGEVGPMPKHEWRDTEIRFQKPDKSWGAWVDLRGPRGFGNLIRGYFQSQVLSIKAGSGIRVTGEGEVIISAVSTGGGFAEVTITGTINDSNVTFTSATEPTYLVMNGAWYKQTGGAITWTYSGGTITLSSPVGTGGSIFGVAIS